MLTHPWGAEIHLSPCNTQNLGLPGNGLDTFFTGWSLEYFVQVMVSSRLNTHQNPENMYSKNTLATFLCTSPCLNHFFRILLCHFLPPSVAATRYSKTSWTMASSPSASKGWCLVTLHLVHLVRVHWLGLGDLFWCHFLVMLFLIFFDIYIYVQ